MLRRGSGPHDLDAQ